MAGGCGCVKNRNKLFSCHMTIHAHLGWREEGLLGVLRWKDGMLGVFVTQSLVVLSLSEEGSAVPRSPKIRRG